jgi:hypothetical protein
VLLDFVVSVFSSICASVRFGRPRIDFSVRS